MEKHGKRIISLLCAAVMLLSFMAVPGIGVQKAEASESALYDEVEAIWSNHGYANYTASTFNADSGTVISDADAYTGTAIHSTVKDLTGAGVLKFYRYNGSATQQYVELGSLSADQIKINEGYQYYKFSVDIPADCAGSGGFLYFFDDNWELTHSSMGTVVGSFAGKQIDIYLSMKVTGEATAATVYIDRMAIVDPCENYGSEDGTACTQCGNVLMTEAEIKLNEMEAAGHIYANYIATDLDLGTQITDSEAYTKQAIQSTVKDLTGAGKFVMYRYCGTADADKQYFKIVELAAEDILINQGYQVYKFSVNIPAEGMGTGGYTYCFDDNWELRSSGSGTVIGNFAGKKLDIYMSMKVTGTYEAATLYVDRFALVDPCENYISEDGATCTKCGKEIERVVDPTVHELYDYNSNYLANGTEVDDADAYKGFAMSYTGKDLTGGSAVAIYRYDTGCANTNHEIGQLNAADIKVDQGYQTYSFTTTLPAEGMTDGQFVYFLADWTPQNAQMCKDMRNLAGQTVIVTLSMKVTGELTNATVYIDRMQIIEPCDTYISSDGSYCTKCGKDIEEEPVDPTIITFTANDFTRPYGDSIQDGAVVYSYATRYAGGDSGLYNAMIRTGDQILAMYTKGGKELGRISIAQLKAASAAGNYVSYKFENVVLDDQDIYMFDCWGFQILYSKYGTLVSGKTVNIYLSMKVTGDVSNTTDNTPTYYIDKVIITDAALDIAEHTHDYSDLVPAGDEVHGKICYDCGALDAQAHTWDEGTVTKEPTYDAEGEKVYTCSVCNGTVTEILAKLPTPAASWNLSLADNIRLNFVLNVTDEQVATATVDYTVNGVTTTKNVSELVTEEGQAILTVELAAAQMTDDVTVTLKADGSEISKIYSVRDYADTILNGDYTDEEKALVKHMLNYGAASQTYFGYNADDLANAGLEITAAEVPTEGGEMEISGAVSGVAFYGASLIHRDTIALRFYFTADSINGISFGEYAVQEKDGMYYVEIDGFWPQDLDMDMTVEVFDDIDTLSVTYAPLDYIIRMYNKGACTELVQALYGYHLAAEAYLISINPA